MGIFDGIEHVAAEGTSMRQYFEPGNYVVKINSVFLHEKRMGGGKLFIVETTIIESDNPQIKAGDKRNWVQSLVLPSALPRIKSFIGAAMGLNSKDINAHVTPTICEDIVGPQNPSADKKVGLCCIVKPTRTGKQFLQHIWGVHHG